METILHLSDKYDLAVVKECCERFLVEQSRRCMVFKFRMAENYGLTSLKVKAISGPDGVGLDNRESKMPICLICPIFQNHCFQYINTIDFCSNLMENIAEFTELAESSKQTLSAHLAMLCETEKTKQNLAAMLQRGAEEQQRVGLANADKQIGPPASATTTHYSSSPFSAAGERQCSVLEL